MGGPSDDVASGVALDGSGNVYTVGYFAGTADFDPGPGAFSLTSAGEADIFVSKLDSAGNLIWARAMGGPSSDDAALGVALDGSGNVYTVGSFAGAADFDPGPGAFNLTSAGDSNIFVSKLDSAGNLIWARAMGGPSSLDLALGGVALDGSGNVYTVGSFAGAADFDPGPGTFNLTSAGEEDIFVSKLDSAGNLIWAQAMGGPSLDQAGGVALDGSGNVYTVGSFAGAADFDPGPGTFNLTSAGDSNIFVSKLDSAGNLIWARAMGGPSSVGAAFGVALDGSSNVYTVGFFAGTADFDPGPGAFNLTSAGGFDIFVCKLGSSDSPSRIDLSVAALTFTTDEGMNSPPQTFEIRNVGGEILNYQVTTNKPWLSVSPEQGSAAGESDTIEVFVNTDGLQPGTHKGAITVSEFQPTKAASPILQSPPAATISVTLVVNPAATGVTPVGIVNAASFTAFAAPAAIMSLFGTGLAEGTETAATTPLPTTLAGTNVTVTDSEGVSSMAELFFVSGGQINFLIPEGTSLGLATVTVTREDGISGTITVELEAVGPALFSANADGMGVAAAVAVTADATGSSTIQSVVQCHTALVGCGALPLDLGSEGDQVFLVLFGTGIRGRSSLSAVSATVGGEDVPVLFAGPQGGFVGLDQVNLGPLPRSLIGRGEVEIVLTVDGKEANTVTVSFR